MSHFNKHSQPLITTITRDIIHIHDLKENKNEKIPMNLDFR